MGESYLKGICKVVRNHIQGVTILNNNLSIFYSVMAEEMPNIEVLCTLTARCLSVVFNLDCSHIIQENDVFLYCTLLCDINSRSYVA